LCCVSLRVATVGALLNANADDPQALHVILRWSAPGPAGARVDGKRHRNFLGQAADFL
jgi:hypothetical protein